jgi:hypothetical protein
VLNGFSNLTASLKYGLLTKSLEFEPSEIADGLYESKLIPTRLGTYYVVLKGYVRGEQIIGEVELDDVEGKDGISFPDTEPESNSASDISGSQLQATLSQLANDLQNTRYNLGQLEENYQRVQTSIDSLNQSTDRINMLAITAIGIGVAGIIIVSFSLSRKIKT